MMVEALGFDPGHKLPLMGRHGPTFVLRDWSRTSLEVAGFQERESNPP